jgi:arylsulfatase A-like enzyme
MPGPNIVLIFPDQWRGDCPGVAGHPCVETPFIDHFAGEGTYPATQKEFLCPRQEAS